MLSIICEAEFHESDSFSKSKSYANLRANKHVENIHSSSIFKELINKLNTDNLEADEFKEQVKSLISNHVETYKVTQFDFFLTQTTNSLIYSF